MISETRFRALTGAWPGVTLDVKWEDRLVASLDGKMFAMFDLRSEVLGRLHFKVDDDLFLALTEQPGIAPAAYLARAKWITVAEPRRHAKTWLETGLRRSYELIAAKLSHKRQRELGLAGKVPA